MIIVIPIDDTEEHDKESTTCKCHPKVEFENGNMILIHDAFDGRQEIEKLGVLSSENKGWKVLQNIDNH
jgi:hypothetical protein